MSTDNDAPEGADNAENAKRPDDLHQLIEDSEALLRKGDSGALQWADWNHEVEVLLRRVNDNLQRNDLAKTLFGLIQKTSDPSKIDSCAAEIRRTPLFFDQDERPKDGPKKQFDVFLDRIALIEHHLTQGHKESCTDLVKLYEKMNALKVVHGKLVGRYLQAISAEKTNDTQTSSDKVKLDIPTAPVDLGYWHDHAGEIKAAVDEVKRAFINLQDATPTLPKDWSKPAGALLFFVTIFALVSTGVYSVVFDSIVITASTAGDFGRFLTSPYLLSSALGFLGISGVLGLLLQREIAYRIVKLGNEIRGASTINPRSSFLANHYQGAVLVVAIVLAASLGAISTEHGIISLPKEGKSSICLNNLADSYKRMVWLADSVVLEGADKQKTVVPRVRIDRLVLSDTKCAPVTPPETVCQECETIKQEVSKMIEQVLIAQGKIDEHFNAYQTQRSEMDQKIFGLMESNSSNAIKVLNDQSELLTRLLIETRQPITQALTLPKETEDSIDYIASLLCEMNAAMYKIDQDILGLISPTESTLKSVMGIQESVGEIRDHRMFHHLLKPFSWLNANSSRSGPIPVGEAESTSASANTGALPGYDTCITELPVLAPP